MLNKTHEKRACLMLTLGTALAIALPGQTFSPVLSFDTTNGATPYGGLMQATNGAYYGATSQGGANCYSSGEEGCGSIFRITPAGNLTTIYSFCTQPSCADGVAPFVGLIQATNGYLYGTAAQEGVCTGPQGASQGAGVVFRVSLAGHFTVLHTFCPTITPDDGASPFGSLIQASNGDLYGTTEEGGANGQGTVFRISPSGNTFKTVYSFCNNLNCTDGSAPRASVIQGADGDLYGTTYTGGANCDGGCGTVFKMTMSGRLTTLYSFCSNFSPPNYCLDGSFPVGGLVQGADGYLYGTTIVGGAACGGQGGGEIFKMPTSGGALTWTYDFCETTGLCVGGFQPASSLIQGTDGNLYGTTL